MRSGYSPIQRVIGYSPRLPGGLLSDGEQDLSTASLAGIGDVGVTKQMEMRKAAATAFHETDCEQAIKNATLAGPRPHRNFEAGQVVYIWRRGADASKKPTANYWHGPARVILINLPNSVWLSYQGYAVKAAPERVRHAGDEEQLSISGWLDGITEARKWFEKRPEQTLHRSNQRY